MEVREIITDSLTSSQGPEQKKEGKSHFRSEGLHDDRRHSDFFVATTPSNRVVHFSLNTSTEVREKRPHIDLSTSNQQKDKILHRNHKSSTHIPI